ncbi:hypothetical protein KUCAC02_033967, partial [Chaenocephalus aceratus]
VKAPRLQANGTTVARTHNMTTPSKRTFLYGRMSSQPNHIGFQVTSDRRSQSLERTRLDSSSCRRSVRLQGDESRHEPQQQG